MRDSHLAISKSAAVTSQPGWHALVKSDTASIARGGYLAICGALLVFVIWGVLVPLSSAVVAPGSVISKGRNQLLQHPSGGVVQEIIANNGDMIEQGEPIVRIEPSMARAELARLHARQSLLRAQKSRLESLRLPQGDAHRSMLASIPGLRGSQEGPYPALEAATPGDDEIRAGQVSEFHASLKRHLSEVSALENRVDSQQNELQGLTNQIAERRRLVALLEGELDRLTPLVEASLISLSQYDAKKATALEHKANLADLKARAASLQSQIQETRDTIVTLTARQEEENAQELSAVLSELAAVSRQAEAASRILAQTIVRAPVSGTLVKFDANTVGGVIEGGKPFGEIVPRGSDVRIEAKVRPDDIGAVRLGQETEIVITAFDRREQPPLEGKVVYIPADSTIDELTGEPYFAVQVDVSDAVTSVAEETRPGMLSQVYIRTGEHSFFTYLLEPFSKSLMTAFRER